MLIHKMHKGRQVSHALEIFLENRQKKIPVSKSGLVRWTEKLLGALGLRSALLSLVLVDDAQIRRLHREFLDVDRTTDVLAFGRHRNGARQFKKTLLGDVVVSLETARRAAPEYGNRWDEELLLYICHGILHLMGYRDSTPRKKSEMDRRQLEVLGKVLGRKWRSKKRKPLF